MMDAAMTIAAVLGMYVLVYYLVTWINRIRTTEQVHCPVKDEDFDVDFVCKTGDMWTPGKRLDVVRCTAFDDPDHVDCGKDCVKSANKAAA